MAINIYKSAFFITVTVFFGLTLASPASRPIRPYGTVSRQAAGYLATACSQLNSHEQLEISAALMEAAYRYGIEVELLLAVMLKESNCSITARSKKGAQGLMQLLPDTALSIGFKNLDDSRENILAGAHYLSSLMKRYRGDKKLALAAYNAGPTKVTRYRGIPPYRETRRYVEAVLKTYAEVQTLFQRA